MGGRGVRKGRPRAHHVVVSSRGRQREIVAFGGLLLVEVVGSGGRPRPRAGRGRWRCLRAAPEREATCARVQTAGKHNERSQSRGDQGPRSWTGRRARGVWWSGAALTDRTVLENEGREEVWRARGRGRPPMVRNLKKSGRRSKAYLFKAWMQGGARGVADRRTGNSPFGGEDSTEELTNFDHPPLPSSRRRAQKSVLGRWRDLLKITEMLVEPSVLGRSSRNRVRRAKRQMHSLRDDLKNWARPTRKKQLPSIATRLEALPNQGKEEGGNSHSP